MRLRGVTERKGIIAWFASNHVAANLLMCLIIVAGLLSAATIRKQTQPDFELNNVQVRVLYLGAAPQEVEEGVVIKVEEAIQDVDGIVKLSSTASEGVGTVIAETPPTMPNMMTTTVAKIIKYLFLDSMLNILLWFFGLHRA